MQALQAHGATNPHGWGIVWFPESGRWVLPVARRGGRPATKDYRFNLASWESALNSCRAIIGHVRFSSTVLSGIPDPHPFLREGIAFAHNGTVSRRAFYPVVKKYLAARPVDYRDFNASPYPEYQVIDTELLFIYMLGKREELGGNTEKAITDLAKTVKKVSPGSTLNLVISDGDTLWALSRGSRGNLLRYFHEPSTGTTAVASEGVVPATWPQIPDWTLMRARRGVAPVFIKIK